MNTHKIKALAHLLMVAVLAVSFSACDESQPMAPEEGLPEEISIGVVLPLSGPIESIGTTMLNAAELALEEINRAQLCNANIKFIVKDSKSTVEDAVLAFNELIDQDSVTAVIGPATSSASQTAFPIAQQNQVVSLSPTAAASGLAETGDYAFQANLTVDVVIPGGVRSTQQKIGYQKAAVLVDSTDVFSQSAYEALESAFNDNGVELLTTETLVTDDVDFSAQLNRIKDASPDAVYILTLPNEAVGVLTQARDLGIPEDVTILVPFALSATEIETAGAAAEGVVTFSTWISSAKTPGNQAFVENYRAKHGVEPNRFLAQAYASVYILAEAIRSAGSVDSGAIRDAMADIRNLDTVLGEFSIDANGRGVYDPILLIVNNGELEIFE